MRHVRALAGGILLTLLVAGTAWAHSETGRLTILGVEELRPGVVRVEAGVVYDDDDLAEEATVEATFTGPEGATVGPVRLAVVSGARYAAEATLPTSGTWQVTVASTDPSASATSTVEVTAAAAEEPDEPPVSTTTAPTEVAEEDDDDTDVAGIVAGAVVLVLVAGAVVVGLRRRGR